MEEFPASCSNQFEIPTHLSTQTDQAHHSQEVLNGDDGVPIKSGAAVEKKKKKNKILKNSTVPNDVHASPSSSSARTQFMPNKGRHPKLHFAATTRRNSCGNCSNLGAAALPLGMTLAAFVTQVLDKNKTPCEQLSADELSIVCASVVRDSLSNVFGNKFDTFSRNFEMSFSSTLKALRMLNQYSQREESSSCNVVDAVEETPPENCSTDHDFYDETRQIIQAPRSMAVARNQLSTMEQCIVEQTRSNNLKAVEVELTMRKLKLKEAQLALTYDSNRLERSKLAMGVSKASFRAEKFKTQLEDNRHGELLKKVLDCLVAGLFIMSSLLSYGAYVFSYRRISEATASCNSVFEGSKSWWVPKQISSFNSGWQILRCQVQVMSRMMFGMMMIVAIAYLLLQRSGGSKQTMPVTFILLLLGVACGIAGKVCVDTLGGNGLLWLMWWEVSCVLYFFSVAFTSTLFRVLYGAIEVGQETKKSLVPIPLWFRRVVYFGLLLVLLPSCCGLLPFAGIGDWAGHLVLLAGSFSSSAVIE